MGIVQDRINASVELKKTIIENITLVKAIEKAAEEVTGCFRNGHRLFLCGNGGSARNNFV